MTRRGEGEGKRLVGDCYCHGFMDGEAIGRDAADVKTVRLE